ncbi:MAG: pyrroline-5-carboxylate reductase [Rhodospirillaceae bacterium]|nr:pyrroline-5-carboxylate reductase [Rhodospirillaceae bacterium]
MIEGTILLVGCGNMGGALVKGWLSQGLNPVDLMLVEPRGRSSVDATTQHPALSVLSHLDEVPSDFEPDVVVFAVKPQLIQEVLPLYKRFARTGTIYLSVVAGVTVSSLRSYLGKDAIIVRTMPNMPAAVGSAISALYSDTALGEVEGKACEVLMSAVGQIVWLTAEKDMNVVTAISGSGPAYVFLLIEALTEAGIRLGLNADLALKLSISTVAGSGELVANSQESPKSLRSSVTSPGGTTEAALQELMQDSALQTLINRAVKAAAKRSAELSG